MKPAASQRRSAARPHAVPGGTYPHAKFLARLESFVVTLNGIALNMRR